MMFITGPLYSGKRTFARNFRGSIIADAVSYTHLTLPTILLV